MLRAVGNGGRYRGRARTLELALWRDRRELATKWEDHGSAYDRHILGRHAQFVPSDMPTAGVDVSLALGDNFRRAGRILALATSTIDAVPR